MMKLKLVDDWKSAWRWISVNCMALAVVVQGAWEFLPADLKNQLSSEWVRGIAIALLVLGILGRLIKQERKNVGDADQ